MSSRNRFLSVGERAKAPLLIEVLRRAAERIVAEGEAHEPLSGAAHRLAVQGFICDYIALVDGPTMTPINRPAPEARLIVAARLGSVRLLDNIGLA